MTISMYSASVPVFQHMLGNLSHILDKGEAHAEAKKFDPVVLLHIPAGAGHAAVHAPGADRLRRRRRTAWRASRAWRRRSSTTTKPRFAELRARIQKTLDYLATRAGRAAGRHRGQGNHLPGRPRQDPHHEGPGLPEHWVLPNFYFHVTTAYAILRHNGVDLGKADYLVGAAALRPGGSCWPRCERGQPVEFGADIGHAAGDHHAAGAAAPGAALDHAHHAQGAARRGAAPARAA